MDILLITIPGKIVKEFVNTLIVSTAKIIHLYAKIALMDMH